MTAEDLAARRGMETEVYEAAEDSRLLADAAVERVGADERVLDVGTGSGYVGGRVASETGASVVACDVNPHACRRAHEAGLPAVRSDLVSAFRDGCFDRVLFNPPYLPTPPEMEGDDWMERALSGGPDGRRIIDPFLDAVGRVLNPGGSVLLLVSSLTGLDAVEERAAANGMRTGEVATESFPYERLVVLELLEE